MCPNWPRIYKFSGLRRHILSANPGQITALVNAPEILFAEKNQVQEATVAVEFQPDFGNSMVENKNTENNNFVVDALLPSVFDSIFSSNLSVKCNHGLYTPGLLL